MCFNLRSCFDFRISWFNFCTNFIYELFQQVCRNNDFLKLFKAPLKSLSLEEEEEQGMANYAYKTVGQRGTLSNIYDETFFAKTVYG